MTYSIVPRRQSAAVLNLRARSHPSALFGAVIMLAFAWALGISAIGTAHADQDIVVVDGEQEVWGDRSTEEPHRDLYIVEQDDVTDELLVYVWRDSDGDGLRDSFGLVTRTTDGWTELAGQ